MSDSICTDCGQDYDDCVCDWCVNCGELLDQCECVECIDCGELFLRDETDKAGRCDYCASEAYGDEN